MAFVDYSMWSAAREMLKENDKFIIQREKRELYIAHITVKLTSRAIYPTPVCKGPPEPRAVSPAVFVQNYEIGDDSEP